MKLCSLLFISILGISVAYGQESVNYLNMDAHFIENKGQWPSQVKFLGVADKYNVWVTNDALIFDVALKDEGSTNAKDKQIKRDVTE